MNQTPQTATRAVETLKPGNQVDLHSCPFLSGHPTADDYFATVSGVVLETPNCVAIAYEDLDTVGYPAGTVLSVRVPRDVPDPVAKVRIPGSGGEWSEWKISQNLTDRWGEINDYSREKKPLELLEQDTELLERLRSQMWDEATFVARKDGRFGILFEVEFCSRESEESEKDHDPYWYSTLRPHDQVVKVLLADLAELAREYPGVEFAVPSESEIIDDRPAAWAFVADGLLDDKKRAQLGLAMLSL